MFLPQFFAQHPVFRVSEIKAHLESHGSTNPNTRNAALAYHLREGHILRIRRGLYASVPAAAEPGAHEVDPFHVAARATEDAILAYHSALAVHLSLPPHRKAFIYLTGRSLGRPFRFQGHVFRGAQHPKALRTAGIQQIGTLHLSHRGLQITLTSIERTLVDILDRPILTGRWGSIWSLLGRIPRLDPHRVLEYALALENATAAAKVGFFLEQRRDALSVGPEILAHLKTHRPSSPHYMDRLYAPESQLVGEWNLIVPQELVEG